MSVKWNARPGRMALAAFLLFAAGAALADDYPNKPIRLILSFPPGGGTDLLGRTVSQKLA